MRPICVQLGDVVTVDRKAASEDECRSLPFVGLEHVEKDTGLFDRGYRRQPESVLATKFRFTPQHVLYSKLRPYLNKVVLPNFDGVSTTEILPIRAEAARLNRIYLYFLLRSPRFVAWASHNVSGANLPRLDPETLQEFPFLLPSLDEQKVVVAGLLASQDLIRSRRYALGLCDEFLPAAFLKMFGDLHRNSRDWETVSLGDLIQSGPQNGIYKPGTKYGSGTRILRIDAFHNGRLNGESSLKRVQLTPQEVAHYRLDRDDIVINRVNSRPYLGKSLLIPRLAENTVFESNMMRFAVNHDAACPVFLVHQLQSTFANRQIQTAAKDAVNQASINQEDVQSLEVRLPPLPLQHIFAGAVDKHFSLRATHVEALRQADHLFQSLLHRAFNGEC